ncbi:MAG: DUF58 domain-containing protein [Clostridiales bacterium]|nr:DUF58 domain-containing protein [Clostridiales bacterium]
MCALVINEALLEQIELLQLLLKNNIAGMFGGTHQSKTFGSSCEFTDFRDYIPGDDVSKIDWNAFARFKKLYLKLYLDERQVQTKIYIDASRSMAYGNGKKHEQALRLAAAFAYISICEMDRVSIYLIKGNRVEDVVENMLGKESYLNNIGKLNDVVFDGDVAISEAILPSKVGYGDGTSIIISDFLTDNDYEEAIDYLVRKKRDVLCVQVLSPEELNPKARGKMHFYDSEVSAKYYRKNINKEILHAYRLALDYITTNLRTMCQSRGVDYALVASDEKLVDVLFDKLSAMGVIK